MIRRWMYRRRVAPAVAGMYRANHREWVVGLMKVSGTELLSREQFRALYEQEWPPATCSKEDVIRNRGCPHGGGRYDCECRGDCPWFAERELQRRSRVGRRRSPW